MANVQALKDSIKESGIPTAEVARRSGMLRETLYNRLAGRGDFKASEIVALTNVLHLTREQRDNIFFAEMCE